MDRLIELGQLADWYGAFLTERQRSLLRQYAFEDCSLSEIAEREGISRQAVRDSIAKAEAELRVMEERLHLIQKSERLHAVFNEMLLHEADEAQRARITAAIDILEDDDGV